jgi:hypothetical protein
VSLSQRQPLQNEFGEQNQKMIRNTLFLPSQQHCMWGNEARGESHIRFEITL